VTEILERDSIADELIDELLPEGVDWERLVVRYPIPALLVAAVGGFFIGRSHGTEILSSLSGFAASEFSRNVNHLFDRGE
jgi:hypothetical protein